VLPLNNLIHRTKASRPLLARLSGRPKPRKRDNQGSIGAKTKMGVGRILLLGSTRTTSEASEARRKGDTLS
jgi:hypothetical protein